MVRFTSSKETGTVRCTKCGGLTSGELQYTGDNYCKGHEQLNISRVSGSLLPLDVHKKARELSAGQFIDWWFAQKQ